MDGWGWMGCERWIESDMSTLRAQAGRCYHLALFVSLGALLAAMAACGGATRRKEGREQRGVSGEVGGWGVGGGGPPPVLSLHSIPFTSPRCVCACACA